MEISGHKQKQPAEMSARYLEVLLEVRRTEVEELEWEQRRRASK